MRVRVVWCLFSLTLKSTTTSEEADAEKYAEENSGYASEDRAEYTGETRMPRVEVKWQYNNGLGLLGAGGWAFRWSSSCSTN